MVEEEVSRLEGENKPPIIERTDTRGTATIEFPVWGGSFKAQGPATNRSLMLVLFAACIAVIIVFPTCCYLVFVRATAENIEEVSNMFVGRKPERRQTPKGTMVEVCPPCPPCDLCEPCPQCPAPPSCTMPHKLAPIVEHVVDNRKL